MVKRRGRHLSWYTPLLTTTPTGRRLSSRQISPSTLPCTGWSSVILGSNSCHTHYESATLTTRLPRPPGRIQTHDLWVRSRMRYPLRSRDTMSDFPFYIWCWTIMFVG
ncbi:hypothetical protein TNCV_2040961 [Trichonephila clavipes]|nr:hypothetical protein TNCV_2040961 [Trichonephila clavipes]